jgi:2-aminoadipate transaminase
MSDEEIQSDGGPAEAISFVYGFPDPDSFPIGDLIAACQTALREKGRTALQYGPTRGYGPLLDYLLAKFQRDEGLTLDRENLLISAGASQALDMICCLFTRPGDTVLVEAPTYHETLMILRDYGLNILQVPLDEKGLLVGELEQRLEWLAATGRRPKFIYVIPDFQNPSGLTLSLERREKLIALAHRYETLIVEDDVYRDLCYEARYAGSTLPSLYALDEGRTVLRLGSFSKIIAAGLRLGWIMAAPQWLNRLMDSGLAAAAGGANPFVSHVVADYCLRGLLEPHIATLVARYRLKRDTMLAALDANMPAEVSWTRPMGGFFVWLTLPPGLAAQEVRTEGEQRGITFLPGPPFFAEGGGENNVRLAFSYLSPQDIEKGVAVLGEVTRKRTNK